GWDSLVKRKLIQVVAVILIIGVGVVLHNYQGGNAPTPLTSNDHKTPSPGPKPAGLDPKGNGQQPAAALKTMIPVDYPALWKQHNKWELNSEAQAQHFLEVVCYTLQPDGYFAADMVGSGRTGPIAVAARVQAQPEVMNIVQAAAGA